MLLDRTNNRLLVLANVSEQAPPPPPPALPGDFDGNGVLDGQDYAVLISALGRSADLDGDNTITFLDRQQWVALCLNR